MSAKRVAVFLDRDGTLNKEVNYLRSPEELDIFEGVAAAIRNLNELGILTCVISNQSGIARGFLTEADLCIIHKKLESELLKEGARLDKIYYCPHLVDGLAPYNTDCDCRKPKSGMLLQGARDLDIDLSRSFVVGDSTVDMQAGIAVGATTILVLTGYGEKTKHECAEQNIHIDFVAPTLAEATRFIQSNFEGRMTSQC